MIIYKTTNLINNKIYIGQDSNNDSKYLGSGHLIVKAIKKYGEKNFKKEILEFCKSKKELNEKEILWIKKFNSTNKKIGYNISSGGTGGKLIEQDVKKGKTYEEYYGKDKAKIIKAKFSKARKGKPLILKNITKKEVAEKISKAHLKKNKKLNKEEKEKISNSVKKFFNSSKGKKLKNKLRKLRTGKKLSEETKAKQSQRMKEIGFKPKKLEVHPSSEYWYFYDSKNNLILKTLGNYIKSLKSLNTYDRKIVKFTNMNECLNYELPKNKNYKVYHEKYYKK